MASEKLEYWRSPEGLRRLEGWTREGLTYAQIARNCGCTPPTLWKWRTCCPEIAEVLEKSAEGASLEYWRTPEGLQQLEGWARDGLTYEQIAGSCGCAPRTLWKWRTRCPEIAKALEKSAEADGLEYWRTPESLLLLEGWARDGLTYEQIARNCGCAPRTLREWRARCPEIAEALKKGAEVVNFEVENALLKRALGYEYQELRVEVSEQGDRKVTELTKHARPDVGAAAFWLRNRRRERYGGQQPEAAQEDSQTGCIVLPEARAIDSEEPENAEKAGETATQFSRGRAPPQGGRRFPRKQAPAIGKGMR